MSLFSFQLHTAPPPFVFITLPGDSRIMLSDWLVGTNGSMVTIERRLLEFYKHFLRRARKTLHLDEWPSRGDIAGEGSATQQNYVRDYVIFAILPGLHQG